MKEWILHLALTSRCSPRNLTPSRVCSPRSEIYSRSQPCDWQAIRQRKWWGSDSCFLLQKPGGLIVPDPPFPLFEVSCWVCLSFLYRKNIGRLNPSLTKKGKLNELKRRNRFAVKRLVVFLFSLWAVAFVWCNSDRCPVQTIHRAAYLVEGQSEVIWSNLIGQSLV